MKTLNKYVIVIVAISLFSNCKQDFPEKNQTGMITYSLNPLKVDSVFQRLPTQMTFYFDGSKTCKTLILGDGNMRLRSIADAATKEHTLLLEGLNKNISMQIAADQIEFGIPELQITETGNEAIFNDYAVSEVCIKDYQREFCELYYTREIGSPGLNWNTPFNSIDGILLKYIMSYRNISMEVVAKTVDIGPIEKDIFLLPLNTIEVSASDEMIIY